MANSEAREAAKASVEASERERKHSAQKVQDATNQILTISNQLHLTWDEFERAVAMVKKCAHIS